jgi:hypothetical protein
VVGGPAPGAGPPHHTAVPRLHCFLIGNYELCFLHGNRTGSIAVPA